MTSTSRRPERRNTPEDGLHPSTLSVESSPSRAACARLALCAVPGSTESLPRLRRCASIAVAASAAVLTPKEQLSFNKETHLVKLTAYCVCQTYVGRHGQSASALPLLAFGGVAPITSYPGQGEPQ